MDDDDESNNNDGPQQNANVSSLLPIAQAKAALSGRCIMVGALVFALLVGIVTGVSMRLMDSSNSDASSPTMPTGEPTRSMTPTFDYTSTPTMPTGEPTRSMTPTFDPTSAPAKECVIEVDLDFVEIPLFPDPPIIDCTSEINFLGFLLMGNNCEEEVSGCPFFIGCDGFNGGPDGYPFFMLHVRAYSYDEFGNGNYFFDGPMPENRTVHLERPDSSPWPTEMVLEIYDNESVGLPGANVLLQRVSFDISCSRPLTCVRFFALGYMLQYFETEDQGLVYCMEFTTIRYSVTTPTETAMEIITAVVETNFTFPRFLDLGLSGTILPGGSLVEEDLLLSMDPRLAVLFNAVHVHGFFGVDFHVRGRTANGLTCPGEKTVTFNIAGLERFVSCPSTGAPTSLPTGIPI